MDQLTTEGCWHRRSKRALVTIQRVNDQFIVSGVPLDRLPGAGDPDDDYEFRFRTDQEARAARGYRAVVPVCECTYTFVDEARGGYIGEGGKYVKPPKVERKGHPCARGVAVPDTTYPANGLRMRGRCKDADDTSPRTKDHRRRFCHGGWWDGRRAFHAEHVIELAEAVLDSYEPKHAKPLRRANVGALVGYPAGTVEQACEYFGVDLSEFERQLAAARAEKAGAR